MTLICCVDDAMGMAFNKRRQSRDIEVTKKIIGLCQNKTLFIDEYSKKLFEETGFTDFKILESGFSEFSKNSCCFLEKTSPSPYEKYTDKIILFRWNRAYPGDTYFDIDLNGGNWHLTNTEEFAGKSHEKITMEVYEK